METEMSAILSFNQVSKHFTNKQSNRKTALNALSMHLYPGMVVGLLGQNGAGKSTLMRCALGILSVDDGKVLTLGDNPQHLSTAAKSRIGYVPQQPFGYEGFSVAAALDLHRSFYPDWDINLEQDWLVRFELDPQQSVQKLSVGQRQALALIMAMAYRPELLILDEPVASLDPVARRKFMADLFELALESGSAVLFSSHITSDLERVASHVALIKQGKLVLFKEIDALREEVKLVTMDDGAKLPDSVKVLSEPDQASEQASVKRFVVESSLDLAKVAGVQQVQALNLEQLFMELHQ
ncbi:ABC transporter ATP-binding protein [Shewanella maritima]|uniref:ABC transporter ATP-binding protein n=1 Tax=Shewanella maritima TaxID=2520507 RepID=UPI003736813B